MLQQQLYQSSPFLPPDESLTCQNSTKTPLKDAMEYEGARLSTFATFPDIPGIYATKLASAGFYYLGKGDEVVCFKCKIAHKNWKRHDSPLDIHQLISPLCDFIKQTKFVAYSQNITAGAVSNGARYSNEDHCRCFFCGGGLRNWEPGDQPWTEHARWYQNCAFVRNCKGERFIQDVQTNNMQAKIVEKVYITSTALLETIFNIEEKSNHTQQNSNITKPGMEESQSAIGPATTTQVNNEPASDPELELSVRSLEEENQNLKDQQTCKICLDEPIAIVFLPCGHLAACVTCAPALRRCPICRTFIKGTVKAIMC
ncbi:unnamed protein product [Mytilus edulis]|uniref:RING-type domain-containing protein n=1 Tax=Mytilus edulis TaxID=6550 RepID=A0A8S3QN67_MYTED|nr:unnamed protein product [Mytilus edulis]